MATFRKYTMAELLGRLGLEVSSAGYVKCPSCGKKLLHVDFEGNYWRCNKCPDAHGGVLHFYQMVKHGSTDLPSDKEGRKKLSAELAEFMGDDAQLRAFNNAVEKREARVPVAPDRMLNDVYSAMMQFPDLVLRSQHRENLRKRGLSDEAIDRNGYRSIPEDWAAPDRYVQMYEANGGDKYRYLRKNHIRGIPKKHIMLGLAIADFVISKGLEPYGVPGFFRFGNAWCYWCNPGILIPTRNIAGEIVIWQIRKDKVFDKRPRYMTSSNQRLKGHVTAEVSRCHFPLANAPLSADTPVYVTEGPLKADVACHLMGKPCAFAAIPGISTTKDLLRYTDIFKQNGVSEIWNALDMDKLTNPNVRKGSRSLQEEFSKQGIRMADLFWGQQYAVSKLITLSLIAQKHHITVVFPPNADSVYDRLNIVASSLNDAEIDPCKFNGKKGTEESYYWDPHSKGIDDYLLHRR